MANPSLQIGNSNWAIKEDNLLGYSTAGTRFVPQPITMTRESAGTRVNSSGLVETVELLGSEEIVNGEFTTNLDSWETSSWWVWNELGAYHPSTSLHKPLYQQCCVIGKTYLITFDLNCVGSSLAKFSLGSSTGSTTQVIDTSLPSGSYSYYVTAAAEYIVFNRQNTAEYYVNNVSVKEYTANNLARVDYDGTASSLLVEPERTNTITYSSDFSNGWAYFDSSTEANKLISPSGVLDASKFIEGNGSSIKRIINLSQYIASGNSYTYSIFAKKGERDFITLTNSTGTADVTTTFDLTNGTVTSGVGSIESLTNGWFRCSRSFTATATVISSYIAQAFINNGSGISYQGDGTSGLYIWNAQLEEGSYPTSYIPTDGGTVTRVQDQYSKTGISNLINSEDGVLFVEMAALSNDLSTRMISLSDGSNTNRIHCFYYSASNTIGLNYRVAGVTQASITASLGDETDFKKIAFRWESGNFKLYIDGIPSGTDANTTMLPSDTLNKLAFEQGDGGSNFYGKVKQLQIFKTALTDPELVTLTT